MVIRGNTRGNGRQLAQYLLTSQANERVQILDVAGRLNADDNYLHQTLHGMSLTAELTKSQKGLYHAQINPAYKEDRRMSADDWRKAADILAHELGFADQRRIIVLHTKKQRTHAHVVFERYNHQTGTVIANKFSRLAQDRARKEMERVFEHQPTPHRNPHRPELKEALTKLWQQSETGQDFIKSVHDNGYLLAEGVPRHPFMVVDENGRSFDLVRQLQGIRIKEVRQRLRHEKLMPEKEAIERMRQKQDEGSNTRPQQADLINAEAESLKKRKDRLASFMAVGQGFTEAKDSEPDQASDRQKQLASEFIHNFIHTDTQAVDSNAQVDQPETSPVNESPRQQRQQKMKEFIQSEDEVVAAPENDIAKERQQAVTSTFFDNQDMVAPTEPKRENIEKLMQEQKELRQQKQQGHKKRMR